MGMKWKHFGMYNVAFWVYGIVSAISAWLDFFHLCLKLEMPLLYFEIEL